MNPQEPSTDVPPPTPANEEQIDPALPAGSHQLVVIRRHPFGLAALFFQVIVGLSVAFALIFFLLPPIISNGDAARQSSLQASLLAIMVIIFAITAIFLVISTALYRQNRWVVSDDAITQVLRIGLFRFQTSGLSMANIEDVTSIKTGIFPTLFNYGTLKAETAGAQENFHFYFCPKPEMYAKILLDARERFIEGRPEEAKRANDLLNVPPPPQAPVASS